MAPKEENSFRRYCIKCRGHTSFFLIPAYEIYELEAAIALKPGQRLARCKECQKNIIPVDVGRERKK